MTTRLSKLQRFLLYFIHEIGIEKSKTKFMKLLFLLKQEYGADNYLSFYNFFPYKYGPFSNAVYRDLKKLEFLGYINTAPIGIVKNTRPARFGKGSIHLKTKLPVKIIYSKLSSNF